MSEGRTDLYRMYDEDGALLYVGISFSAASRAAQHRKAQPWWPQMSRIDVEQFDSRDEALVAETTAIREEIPLYNVAGKPKQRESAQELGRRSAPFWLSERAQKSLLEKRGELVRRYTERRDRAIVEAHRAGKSYRHIAERTGLHFTSVANIVNRQTDK